MSPPAGVQPAEVLRVDLSALPPGARRTQATVLASLPGLLSTGARPGMDQAGPGIAVVDGTAVGWPARVARAVAEGRRGVLVAAPTTVPTGEAADVAEQAGGAGCPVVLALPAQFDPSVRAGLASFRASATTLSLVGSLVTVPADGTAQPGRSLLRTGLLAQLAAVRAAAGRLSGLEFSRDTADGYLATARAGAATVMLSGLLSAVRGYLLQVDLVGVSGRCRIRLPDTPSAAPAFVESYAAAGMTRLRLSYAGGLRAAWVNLHAAITAAEPVHYGLPELAHDLAMVPVTSQAGDINDQC